MHLYLFDRLGVCACLSANVQLWSSARLWSLNIMLVSEKGDKMPILVSVWAFDYTSVCVWKVKVVCMCESWSPCPELLALSLWAAVFPSSFRFSIVNEEDRRERGLLVLIYPGGSLGITINSQLLAHSTGPHRHCQFVPIREPSFWVSAVRGCSGPTGEQPAKAWLRPDHSGLGCTQLGRWNTCWLWSPAWYHEAYMIEYAIKLYFFSLRKKKSLMFCIKMSGT